MARGTFIALDGLDGAGKSSQCRALATWLRVFGLTVVECSDPGGTDLGGELRELLLDYRGNMALRCEALLFMASRAQLVAEVIRPALDADSVVVSDRYLLANVVYQGHAGGLDPAELWRVGAFATGGIEPALTIVLDLPLEAAAARRKQTPDRLESRADDFHRRVREGFLAEARRQPDCVAVIDADRPFDAVQEALQAEVARRLPHLVPA